jgi:hypothetical protein
MVAFLHSLPRRPLVFLAVAVVLLLVDDGLAGRVPLDTDAIAVALSALIALTAIALAVDLRITREQARQAVARAALGLAVSVAVGAVSLVAMEYVTRWVFRDVTTTSDDRGYFSKRWLASGAVTRNADGFRERPIAAKAPGQFRIAAVGDSFTFGNGIAAADRYSDVLQRMLPERFEVLNFGVPGDNTIEHGQLIGTRLGAFAPDFVLLQWFVNDVEFDSKSRPPVNRLLPSDGGHDWLLGHSAAYTLLNSWWTRRQVFGQTHTSYAAFLQKRFGDPQSDAVRREREAMRAVAGAARAIHAPLGVVLFPDAGYDLGPGYPFEFLHERVADFCAEQQLTCVDLRPDFAQVKDRRVLWADRLDPHPSATANSIAAIRILKTFEPAWLAPQEP